MDASITLTYASFLEEFLTEDSIFFPSLDSDGCFSSDNRSKICHYTELLYTLICNDSDDLFQLGNAIREKYHALAESNAEDDTFDNFVGNIDAALIQLSHVNQNLGLIFRYRIHEGPDKDLCNSLEKYWSDQNFSLKIGEIVEHAQAAINAINQDLQLAKTRFFQKSSQIERDRLESLLSSAKDFLEQIEKANKETKKAQSDIENHVKSAQDMLNKADKAINDVVSQSQTVEQQSKAIEARSEEIKRQSDGILPNLLTILGIFVAIIIAFIGGYFSIIQAGGISISKIAQVCMAYFLLMGQLLINLIFLFMFMISRLSGRSISVLCLYSANKNQPGTCYGCNNSCPFYRRLWRKYPYLVAVNWAILVGYAVLLLWWYVDTFLFTFFENWINSNVVFLIVIFLVIIFVVTAFLVAIPVCIYFKSRKADSEPS